MAQECRAAQHAAQAHTQRKRTRKGTPETADTPPKPPVAKAFAEPETAWKSDIDDDVILLMADTSSHRLPVRAVEGAWMTLGVGDAVWAIYHRHKAKMRRLGFRAKREADIVHEGVVNRGQWQLVFHP